MSLLTTATFHIDSLEREIRISKTVASAPKINANVV